MSKRFTKNTVSYQHRIRHKQLHNAKQWHSAGVPLISISTRYINDGYIFKKIHIKLGSSLDKQKSHYCAISELLYADDTLLILKDTRVLNRYLQEIILEREKHNLKLNNEKCEYITINHNPYTFRTVLE